MWGGGKLRRDVGQFNKFGVQSQKETCWASMGNRYEIMGDAGTDVALEVADVVLMRDGLSTVPLVVWISRLARKLLNQLPLVSNCDSDDFTDEGFKVLRADRYTNCGPDTFDCNSI